MSRLVKEIVLCFFLQMKTQSPENAIPKQKHLGTLVQN